MKIQCMQQFTDEEITIFLESNGYLLKSKIMQKLHNMGFIVDPNAIVKNQFGETETIDFIVSTAIGDSKERLTIHTNYVVEIINNKQPFILMSNRQSTPNENTDTISFYGYPKENRDLNDCFLSESIQPERNKYFSQYCIVHDNKKDESVIPTTNTVYCSMKKISKYHKDNANYIIAEHSDVDNDSYWRYHIWRPIIVLGGELIVANYLDNGKITYSKIESGFLEFNWHDGDETHTTAIEIIAHQSFFDKINHTERSNKTLLTNLTHNKNLKH